MQRLSTGVSGLDQVLSHARVLLAVGSSGNRNRLRAHFQAQYDLIGHTSLPPRTAISTSPLWTRAGIDAGIRPYWTPNFARNRCFGIG